MIKPPVGPKLPTINLLSLLPFGFSSNFDQKRFDAMIGAKPHWSGFKRKKEMRHQSQ